MFLTEVVPYQIFILYQIFSKCYSFGLRKYQSIKAIVKIDQSFSVLTKDHTLVADHNLERIRRRA